MNKDDIGGHGKVGREESIRPPLHIKNYRYLRRAGNQRGGPSQGNRTPNLSSENIIQVT